MLKSIDKVLAVVTWIVAGVLAFMLLIGPKVVAEDKAKPPPAGQSPYAGQSSAPTADGKALFASNCGSCHTLALRARTARSGRSSTASTSTPSR